MRPRYEGVLTRAAIVQRAAEDPSFREGLLAAAAVCRAEDRHRDAPPCPAGMAAIYLEELVESAEAS